MKLKIYVVGDHGPEHNSIKSIHKSYNGALKDWNELRLELLQNAKSYLRKKDKMGNDMWERIIKNLSCKDPEKIDNYPQETPYIREYELEE